jgi:hypothetical protein
VGFILSCILLRMTIFFSFFSLMVMNSFSLCFVFFFHWDFLVNHEKNF